MKLEDLKNKKILLFGKSRSFSQDELQNQLKTHSITLVENEEDEVDYVIDGAMMTPAESLKSEEIYEKKDVEFLKIELLEKLLSDSLDEDVLMMSLKLSSDKQRLKNFLTNPQISDELYFKLLSMYDWGGDDFYENDDNRDITASIIKRFYKNIDRNHNIEFSILGLMHLVVQTKDGKLLEAIANLKPLKKSFHGSEKDQGFRIITSIATNICTPKGVLKMLIKESNIYVKTLISMRDFLDDDLQHMLYETGEKEVWKSLTYCKTLSDDLYEKLREDSTYAKHMAKYIKLDKGKYDFFEKNFPSSLAQNETISLELQNELIDHCLEDVKENLAANKNISHETILELLKQKDEKVDFAIYSNPSTPQDILYIGFEDINNHFALAHNENTPANLLREIYEDSGTNIHAVLAQNPSTPVDILYQLQLDSKCERYVKENPSFGKHIQKENIGWQV
jgi:hypothetical protein